MAKILNIFHLGPGRVGKTFLRQLDKNRKAIEKRYNFNIRLLGIFDSERGVFEPRGIKWRTLKKIAQAEDTKRYLPITRSENLSNYLHQCQLPLVVIETTASEKTDRILLAAQEKGAFVVLSNKKPLSKDYQTFKKLTDSRRVYFETTVGAGLPVISTIKELLETGDEIMKMEGCFSGTLSFIFSLLEKGEKFSQVIKEAKRRGLTEPDPRDDLSGLDVARKALILARILGKRISLREIKVQSLVPPELESYSLKDFLTKTSALDKKYKKMMAKLRAKNQTLRYVAQVDKKSCFVGICQVKIISDLGSLQGPNNIVIIKSKRYNRNPLVIKGPGAGAEVTAAGVLGDFLKIIKIIKGGS